MMKTCIRAGKYALDIIKKRNYPEGFVIGRRNKFVDELFKEGIGNTCGNVANHPAISWRTDVSHRPIRHV